MTSSSIPIATVDKGGRRIGIERRQFSYTDHVPESRSGRDRRIGVDRRSGIDRRCGRDIKKKIGKDLRRNGDRRSDTCRRSALLDTLTT